jgi:hypothetical protein
LERNFLLLINMFINTNIAFGKYTNVKFIIQSMNQIK